MQPEATRGSRPHPPVLLVAGLLLGACSHTDPYLVESSPFTGPVTESSNQLTFNAGDDIAPRWSADGRSVAYAYVDPGRANNSRCAGVLAAMGGTRLVTLCETRATHADSVDSFASPVVGPLGDLMYLHVTAKRSGLVPSSITLWQADTAAPLVQRRLLAKFPMGVGGTIINWLSEISWQSPDRFVALASTLQVTSRFGSPIFDTLYQPHFLVQGNITATGATFSAIPGTDSAITWAEDDRGDLIIVRGNILFDGDRSYVLPQRRIYRVPSAGGDPTLVAETPSTSLGVESITCHGDRCIVLDRRKDCPANQAQTCGTTVLPVFYTLTLSTADLQVRTLKRNFKNAHIDPSGLFFVYARLGDIFRDNFPVVQ